MKVLTTYLACTACGTIVKASYEENLARIQATPFPRAVTPFKCSTCLERKS